MAVKKPTNNIWHAGEMTLRRGKGCSPAMFGTLQKSLYLPDAVDCVAALPHLPHGDARQKLNDVGLGNGDRTGRCEISLWPGYVIASKHRFDKMTPSRAAVWEQMLAFDVCNHRCP